jgi:hypothetical protein
MMDLTYESEILRIMQLTEAWKLPLEDNETFL